MLAVGGYAVASNGTLEPVRREGGDCRVPRPAALRRRAGYTIHVAELSGATCIANGADGAMGDHFVNGSRLVDEGVIDAAAPEALVYERRNNGTLQARRAASTSCSRRTGRRRVTRRRRRCSGGRSTSRRVPNRYGLPPFYALHAWVWKPNPSGMLFAWNPRVSCEASRSRPKSRGRRSGGGSGRPRGRSGRLPRPCSRGRRGRRTGRPRGARSRPSPRSRPRRAPP